MGLSTASPEIPNSLSSGTENFTVPKMVRTFCNISSIFVAGAKSIVLASGITTYSTDVLLSKDGQYPVGNATVKVQFRFFFLVVAIIVFDKLDVYFGPN